MNGPIGAYSAVKKLRTYFELFKSFFWAVIIFSYIYRSLRASFLHTEGPLREIAVEIDTIPLAELNSNDFTKFTVKQMRSMYSRAQRPANKKYKCLEVENHFLGIVDQFMDMQITEKLTKMAEATSESVTEEGAIADNSLTEKSGPMFPKIKIAWFSSSRSPNGSQPKR